MPFLEGLLTSTRNLIGDYGRDLKDETSDPKSDNDSTSAPIHKGLEGKAGEDTELRMIEQLEADISKTKAKCSKAKEEGKQAISIQTEEIRNLKLEMQQLDTKLKGRQRDSYDVPYTEYSDYMTRPETSDPDATNQQEEQAAQQAEQEVSSSLPPVEDPSSSNPNNNASPADGPTRTELRLCRMLESQLLKHLHLLMMAEQQLKIQSSIWNDIVLTLHEKPVSLDQDFMDNKLRILMDISTTEKNKTKLEQEGEKNLRKQVLSMCRFKRKVALEVKKKTSMLEEKVFRKTSDNTPTQNLLRSLSNDTINSADLGALDGETKTSSPPIPPKMPILQESSSLKLRLAREKAAARLADSKRRFNNSAGNMSIESNLSLDAITERSSKVLETSTTKLVVGEDQRLSPSGVSEFPDQE